MNQLVKSVSQDIAAEKAAKDAEYEELQHKLQEKTKSLAEKRRQLQDLRSQSEQIDLINDSISNLESAKGSGAEDFDWTGRSSDTEQVPVAFRRKKDSPAPSISMMEMMEMETKIDAAATSQSSTLDDLIMLRRMKLWHERIAMLLTKRQASRDVLASEKERQLRKLVALCTGFSTSEADEVCMASTFLFPLLMPHYSKLNRYWNPSRASRMTLVRSGLPHSWKE